MALLLAMLPLPPPSARAEDKTPLPAFINFYQDRGLSHSNIRAIAQDRHGFIWLGSTLGLNRFDGYTFKAFMRNDQEPGSLIGNFVWALLTDREGVLWVATDNGLDRYDEATETFHHFRMEPGNPRSLPNPTVLALFEDGDGTLWVGSRGGLSRMDRATGTFVTYQRAPTVPGSINANSVRFITEDPVTGLLWLGTSDGLATFDPKSARFASFVHAPDDPESLCHNGVNRVLIDGDGVFWVATDGGLDSFTPSFRRLPAGGENPGRQVFSHFPNNPDDPTSLWGRFFRGGVIDQEGRLWVASDEGLNLIDRRSRRVTHYRHVPGDPDSLADNYTYAVFEDRSGDIWVSTVSKGVCRLRGPAKPFRVMRHEYTNPNSLGDDRVTSLCIDARGHLWVGTSTGIGVHADGRWTRYTGAAAAAAGLPTTIIEALAAGPDGQVWVGTRDSGLFRFDGSRFISHASPAGNRPSTAPESPYTGHEVNGLQFDRTGRLWIAARAYGLDYYDGTKFVHFGPLRPGATEPQRPTAHTVLGALDRDGRYWFSGQAQGLVSLDPAKDEFQAYLPVPNSPGDFANRGMYFVFADGDRSLWVGGISGLHHFDLGTRRFTRRLTQADGLPCTAVTACETDDRGRLWLGTVEGISCFDPATGRFRNYDRADGLPGRSISVRTSARGPDGRLYFGGVGVVSFHPSELRDNPVPPAVVLTDFRLLDRAVLVRPDGPLTESITVAKRIRLGPKQNVFTFGFAALDFTAPEKNSYRYRLDGFDPDWRTAERGQRSATYMNMSPGHYVFRVQAANSDGVWNMEGTSLHVVVDPPWWQRWWFRGAVVCFFVAALLAGIRWRERAIRRLNARLESEVAARTAQLRSAVAMRERAEAALRESYVELEQRVRERTAELHESTRRLEAQMSETTRKADQLQASEDRFRRLNQQLEQRVSERTEALAASNRELEAFSYSVSHDLRAPLRNISGFVELLRRQLQVQLAPAHAHYLEVVSTESIRLGHLIDSLLNFSRIGRAVVQRQDCELASLVAAVRAELQPSLAERELEWRIGPLPRVVGDPTLLRQVFENLLGNAAKFTRHRRPALIEVGELPAPSAAEVLVFVRDNGAGFDPRYSDKLFGVFQRLHKTTEFEGTGVGLANVRRIIERHGGRVWAEGKPDAGATFFVALPRGVPPEPAG